MNQDHFDWLSSDNNGLCPHGKAYNEYCEACDEPLEDESCT